VRKKFHIIGRHSERSEESSAGFAGGRSAGSFAPLRMTGEISFLGKGFELENQEVEHGIDRIFGEVGGA